MSHYEELVRAVGLEPTRAQGPTDFKSGMSTIPSRPHLALVFNFVLTLSGQ